MPYGTVNVDKVVNSDGVTSGGLYGFKNRIINGAMMIDQRNAGASVTASAGGVTYALDRWAYFAEAASKFTVQQNAGAITPPAGFVNYLGVTSSSAYAISSTDRFVLQQRIEGYNSSDLAWGTASAATVTLSFWVRSSLTGTFGGGLRNAAADRSYPFSFTINTANTWEQKSITIAGDTSGTWLTTNGVGIIISFSLGVGSTHSSTAGAWAAGNYQSATGAVSVVGTSGATFYITGVQLEKGSTATSFDYRPYGTELALCQRYYEKVGCNANTLLGMYTIAGSGSFYGAGLKFAVTKRAIPSMPSVTSSTGYWVQPGTAVYSANVTNVLAPYGVSTDWFGYTQARNAGGSTPTANNSYMFEASVVFIADSEL